jgi:glycosyltransferase 2 family protein
MTARSAEQRRRQVSVWLRVVVSVALFAFIVSQVDLAGAMTLILQADVRLLLAAGGLVIALTCFAAYRWYILLIGPSVASYRTVLRLVFLSNLAGMVVPGIIGIEAVKIVGLTRSTSDLARSFTSITVDRMLGMLTLVILVLAGLALSPVPLSPNIAPIGWLCLLGAGVAVVAALNPTVRRWLELCVPRQLKPAVVPRLNKCFIAIDEYRGRPWLLLGAGALATVYQIARALLMTVLAWALGIDVDFSFMMIIVPIVLFLMLLPISISGHGVREAALVYFLAKAGVPAEAAFSLSVLSYLVHVITILPIALLLASTGGAKQSALQASVRGRQVMADRPAGGRPPVMRSRSGP